MRELAIQSLMLLVVGASMVLIGTKAHGQEFDEYGNELHQHGTPQDPDDENGIPNWYDSNCCNKKDCKPVETGALDFVMTLDTRSPGKESGLMVPGVKSTRDGYVYTHDQIRKSQDSRWHECVNQSGYHYCVYVPWGF